MNSKLQTFIETEIKPNLWGIAKTECFSQTISDEIASVAAGLPYAIVLGMQLSNAVTATLINRPNLLYKHHYTQLNYQLDRWALTLSRWLMSNNKRALPIAASQTIDFKRQIGHLSHRHSALCAGIGWLGKNNLVITPQFGAHQRFVTVLTDMRLTPASAQMKNKCGNCTKCIESCPVGALSENGHNIEKCLAALNTFRKIRGIGHQICGMCIKHCLGEQNGGTTWET